MKNIGFLAGVLTAIFMFSAHATNAVAASFIQFDQNITPDVIFGSGNANGGFTTDRQNGIELGLRAKVRFDAANQPQNIFNSNGDGTYSFQSGNPSPGFGFAPDNPFSANWNFEWSINSDFNGMGDVLSEFTYVMQIDFDRGPGTNFGLAQFDPINSGLADHAIGTDATLNGAGVSAANLADYNNLISNNNVAQNSWNYLFFIGLQPVLFPFDPNSVGTYTIVLSAFSGASLLASTSIDIVVSPVPIPGALPLFGSGLAILGFMGFRRKRARRAAA